MTSHTRTQARIGLGLIVVFVVQGLIGNTPVILAQKPDEWPSPGILNLPPAQQLAQVTGGSVSISYHAETGKVRFISASPDRPIRQPAALPIGASPEVAARSFLTTYGGLFGLKNQAQELRAAGETRADRGRSFVRFQQVYHGIPIVGGELIVQVDADRSIVSANGEVLPDLTLDTPPRLNAESASLLAIGKVARDFGLSTADLKATQPELWIYNPALVGGPGLRTDRLVWRTEVTPVKVLPIRVLVLVDAGQGFIVLDFNQVDTLLSRNTYTANGGPALPGTLARSEEDGPTGDSDVDAAHTFGGDTYNFYYDVHGRDSLDDAGLVLTSTVHWDDGLSCPNAFWDGSQMVYCDDAPQADDVVAHEMTHGVTQYESRLFYYMQSGAINEALSDIWGEFVDLTNGSGTDILEVRWQLAEDWTGIGPIRDMSNPPAFGQPDRMTSGYYSCGTGDQGGVHTNSGVANKAAYLMADGTGGAPFNGTIVAGIGITKTAMIWYEAQTHLLTSGSDYQDLYDGLQQACSNLSGTNDITPSDCQQVKNAVDATEMNQLPGACAASESPVCAAGQPLTDLFFDDFETGAGSWSSFADVGSDRWYLANDYATSGLYHLYGYDQGASSDFQVQMLSGVPLPAGSQPYLRFNHAYAFDDWDEHFYDGGVVEYSLDGGSWLDAGGLFTDNGYGGSLFAGYDNPLEERQAFVGDSQGYLSSRADLSSLAGHTARFRFRIGTDSGWDDWGWFIDDVQIYTCGATLPDATSPRVISVTPADTATGVSRDGPVTVVFSEAILTGTLAYSLSPNPGGWSAVWNSASTVVTLTHATFAAKTAYTGSIMAAGDLAGNPLSSAYVWTFTTAPVRVFLPIVTK